MCGSGGVECVRGVEDLNINKAYGPTKLNPTVMLKTLRSRRSQSSQTKNFLM